MELNPNDNLDSNVVNSFGFEWKRFSYFDNKSIEELNEQFKIYCKTINLESFDPYVSIGADFGAGSGRWSERFLPYFTMLYVLEPSIGGFETLNMKFNHVSKVRILNETIDKNSIPVNSLDFAASLGVLHHIPDTQKAIIDISSKIKPGGLLLAYIYYDLADKPYFYRFLFAAADLARKRISKLPHRWKLLTTNIIALFIYFPLAKFSKFCGILGFSVNHLPLHHYANLSFEMMANDSLDRFGTTLEKRFSKKQIEEMLTLANFDLDTLVFSTNEPFWTFSVQKSTSSI